MQGDIFKADVHRAGQEWSRKLDTGIYWRRMLHHSVRQTASMCSDGTLSRLMAALLSFSCCLFVGACSHCGSAFKLTSDAVAHKGLSKA